MSIVVTVAASVFGAGLLYSAFKYAKKVLNNSLIYKDTPELLELHKKYSEMHNKAKSQFCYGDMGRLTSYMVKIEKELSLRSENVRVVHSL